MTKWNLQSEKPIQEYFKWPCWIQATTGLISYLIPRDKFVLDKPGVGRVLLCYANMDIIPVQCSVIDIVAWQYAEMPAAPEPYVPTPALPKMKAEWIDGAVRPPKDNARVEIKTKGLYPHKDYVKYDSNEGLLYRVGGAPYQNYYACNCYWLEITEEQS